LQDPPKFSQIGIFGLKICYLAALVSFSGKILINYLTAFGDEVEKLFVD
jgi:hypothetical protein